MNENAWLIERHELGALQVKEAADVFRRNRELLAGGEPVRWVVLGGAPTLSQARELELEIKREVRHGKVGA